jgi:hypothetical protein
MAPSRLVVAIGRDAPATNLASGVGFDRGKSPSPSAVMRKACRATTGGPP